MKLEYPKNVKNILNFKESPILIVLIVIAIFLAIMKPTFISFNNLLNIGRQSSLLGILSIGMGLVIITGGIDLSIGAIYAFSGIIAGLVLGNTGSSLLAYFLGLSSGIIIGAINGLLTEKVKIPAFITTFGSMYVVKGLSLIITNGMPVTLLFKNITENTNPFFYYAGRGFIFGKIPTQFAIMIALFFIFGYILHKAIFGLHIFAVGGNEKAAYVCGIKVNSIRFASFVISGFLASLAGILSLSYIGTILPTAGSGMEFEAIAAVVIGGVSFSGGIGSMLGIFIGVIIMGVIKNGLMLLGISSFWQILIIGLVTISAVAYDSTMSQRRKNEVA